MNGLQLFENGGWSVRVVDRNGEPWFVAKDVCDALMHTNHRTAIERLDDDEKGVSSIYTPGGTQRMAVVNEPGLYNLILTSRLPKAKEFKRWITHDVMPSIRKTGQYSIGGTRQQYKLPQNYVEALEALLASERDKLAMSHQLEEQAPKVALYDVAMSADNAQPIGTVAKTLNIGPNKLFALLREQRVLISHGSRYNQPYQEYIDRGYFKVRQFTITHFTQGIENKSQTLVTAKGMAFIHRLLEQVQHKKALPQTV